MRCPDCEDKNCDPVTCDCDCHDVGEEENSSLPLTLLLLYIAYVFY